MKILRAINRRDFAGVCCEQASVNIYSVERTRVTAVECNLTFIVQILVSVVVPTDEATDGTGIK